MSIFYCSSFVIVDKIINEIYKGQLDFALDVWVKCRTSNGGIMTTVRVSLRYCTTFMECIICTYTCTNDGMINIL